MTKNYQNYILLTLFIDETTLLISTFCWFSTQMSLLKSSIFYAYSETYDWFSISRFWVIWYQLWVFCKVDSWTHYSVELQRPILVSIELASPIRDQIPCLLGQKKIQACYPLDPGLLSSCWLTLKVCKSLLRQSINKQYQKLAHHFSSLSVCIKCVNISQVRKAGQYSKEIEFYISYFWTLPRPQPLNWFFLFFMSDAHCNTLF